MRANLLLKSGVAAGGGVAVVVGTELSGRLIYYLLFCPTVTCLGRPIQAWARFNLLDALVPELVQESAQ